MSPGDTVHASVVRVGGRGVLIRGASGSGKSSLLLALLAARDADAILVADDRAALSVVAGRLVAAVPETIAGLLEIRGVGIVRRAYVPSATIDLVVELRPFAECPRLPDAEEAVAVLAGVSVRRIFIATGARDGPVRVAAALAATEPAIPT